ncbi:MAG: hypothetical protein H6739_35365 [Alphaproteobacteria bacterium]|nr:hypothetical protein [Alphaproteobacteria bacterium]
MTPFPPFERPPGGWAPCFSEAQLAEVITVEDSGKRVEIRLMSCDGPDGQDGPIWARVAAPFAGTDRGAFFIPDVGDEVLVTFVNGDPRFPVVVGSLWNGAQSAPETLGGDRVDRWTLTGKNGTRIAIVEEGGGQDTIAFSTPGGVTGTLTDDGGGKVEIVAAGNTVTIDSGGVTVDAASTVSVTGSKVEVSAGMVSVSAAMADFSGIVKCTTLQATTVVASTYTPGAGNVW